MHKLAASWTDYVYQNYGISANVSSDFSLSYGATDQVFQYIILLGKCQVSAPLNRAWCNSTTCGAKKGKYFISSAGPSLPFNSSASSTILRSCRKYILSLEAVTELGVQ